MQSFCNIDKRAQKSITDFSGHHGRYTVQYSYLFFIKSRSDEMFELPTCSNSVWHVRYCYSLVFNCSLFQLLYLYIWLSAYLSHQLQGLISLRFIKHFDLGGMGNSEVLLVLSCTLTDSLEIVLCQHTSKTTLIRFSSFRKFG